MRTCIRRCYDCLPKNIFFHVKSKVGTRVYLWLLYIFKYFRLAFNYCVCKCNANVRGSWKNLSSDVSYSCVSNKREQTNKENTQCKNKTLIYYDAHTSRSSIQHSEIRITIIITEQWLVPGSVTATINYRTTNVLGV